MVEKAAHVRLHAGQTQPPIPPHLRMDLRHSLTLATLALGSARARAASRSLTTWAMECWGVRGGQLPLASAFSLDEGWSHIYGASLLCAHLA